jgi:hypothetical protein
MHIETEKPGTASFSSVLTMLAQGLSLAGVLSFALAVMINTFIFEAWGLSFLQLATPGDVVASGLAILAMFSSLFFPLGAGALLWSLPFRPRRRAALPRIFSSILYGSLAVGVVSAVTVHYDSLVHVIEFKYIELILWVSLISTILMLISGGAVIVHVFINAGSVPVYHWVALIMLSGFLIFGSVNVISLVRNWGMPGNLKTIVPACGRFPGSILWTGERAVVVRCRSQKIIVLYGSENLVMSQGGT